MSLTLQADPHFVAGKSTISFAEAEAMREVFLQYGDQLVRTYAQIHPADEFPEAYAYAVKEVGYHRRHDDGRGWHPEKTHSGWATELHLFMYGLHVPTGWKIREVSKVYAL